MYPEIAFDPHHSKTRQMCRFTSPIAKPIIPPSTFQAQAADDILQNPSELLDKCCQKLNCSNKYHRILLQPHLHLAPTPEEGTKLVTTTYKQKLTAQLLITGNKEQSGWKHSILGDCSADTCILVTFYWRNVSPARSTASISFLLQSQVQRGKTSSLGGKHLLQASLLSSSSNYKNSTATKTSQFLLSYHLRCRCALHNLKCQKTLGTKGSSSRALPLTLPSLTHRKSVSAEVATSCHLLHIRTKPDSHFSDYLFQDCLQLLLVSNDDYDTNPFFRAGKDFLNLKTRRMLPPSLKKFEGYQRSLRSYCTKDVKC